MHLELGATRFDITHRAVVMGILNRTPDSFYDQGAYYDFDDFLRKAEQLVADGADFLDVGGVKAGPGEEVTRPRSWSGSCPPSRRSRARFDVPLSVDTWRASVAGACFAARCGGGQRHQRLRRPRLPRRCAPRPARRSWPPTSGSALGPRPRPALRRRGRHRVRVPGRPGRAGPRRRASRPRGSWSTPASTWARPRPQSLVLLRASDRLAELGYPVFLSASNKRFLWTLLEVDRASAGEGTMAAHALGIALGCRILRAHDVRNGRRVADVMAAVLAAA